MLQFPRELYKFPPKECPLCHEFHSGNPLCLWSGGSLAISRNKYPYNQDPNHLLIYPQRHITSAAEMTPTEYAEFPAVHKELTRIL